MTLEQDRTVDQVIAQLSARRSDALATLELLHGYAQQVEAGASALENPGAVQEYVDFFLDTITHAAADCERIAADLITEGVKSEHLATLREWANRSAAEQRRCLLFRDKWINKPLPQESMRPLLNEISVTTRDQLTAFRDLSNAATTLEDLLKPGGTANSAEGKRGFDRRQLFTRLFKP